MFFLIIKCCFISLIFFTGCTPEVAMDFNKGVIEDQSASSRSTPTHYSDSVFALTPYLLRAKQRSNNYQFYSLLFDTIRARTHDLTNDAQRLNQNSVSEWIDCWSSTSLQNVAERPTCIKNNKNIKNIKNTNKYSKNKKHEYNDVILSLSEIRLWRS
jgi:hypothetical protein